MVQVELQYSTESGKFCFYSSKESQHMTKRYKENVEYIAII